MLLAIPVALIAGIVAFASPCVLPLVPGYLSYVTGLSGVSLARRSRGRMLLGTTLFVLGFTVVFVGFGMLFGSLGGLVKVHSELIMRVAGVLVIAMGCMFLGWIPGVSSNFLNGKRPAPGLVGAPVLGFVFGLSWAPCIGPTLAAVLILSAQSSELSRGATLAFAYCLGLGLPFILVALAFERGMRAVTWLGRHKAVLTRLGGGLLIVMGVLLVSGLWLRWTSYLQGTIAFFEPVV
ncbi:cytochrome c biogenesis protein CcdA [Micrococcales bacterium 31B]|nr:cytochrome c biogenesis protein CcdA [Micrococcales bacterium 31B]